jgi:hypothetical protein
MLLIVAILRSFEDRGWIQDDGAVGAVRDTDGLSRTADELDRIEPEPDSMSARFGDDRSGEHIVGMWYWDGDEVVFHESITTPTLLLELAIRPGGFAGGTGIGDPSVLQGIGDVQLDSSTPRTASTSCRCASF